MLTWFAKRFLAKFERQWGYDTSYARDMLDAGGYEAIAPMFGIQKVTKYRRDIPNDVLATAGLVGVRAGDCGPCLQLGVKMALHEGVPQQTIAAVLSGDREAMSESVRLSYDFTRSVLARDGQDGPLREALEQRYGKRAIISLAYTIAASRFYPDLKYALGAGHACSRVRVGDLDVIPQPV
ncbi:MAG TPA: hypothetical protein VFL13_04495 [Candidatus Baltobacteraceae bacterium]|nr:hypothetical protein [Candidatus Baltobacteraceae bacterium]